MEVEFTPLFVRRIKKLPVNLQEEVFEKIELFSQSGNHPSLKVRPLHGRFSGAYTFSVNYKYSIIFEYSHKKTVATLLDFGGHDVYKS